MWVLSASRCKLRSQSFTSSSDRHSRVLTGMVRYEARSLLIILLLHVHPINLFTGLQVWIDDRIVSKSCFRLPSNRVSGVWILANLQAKYKYTDGAEGLCMAAGRRVRCPPGPELVSAAEIPWVAEVLAFLNPPCMSLGPPFENDDRGFPADSMSLLVSVAPVSSCSRAARSILFGARPLRPWPFVFKGDCGLLADILDAYRCNALERCTDLLPAVRSQQ